MKTLQIIRRRGIAADSHTTFCFSGQGSKSEEAKGSLSQYQIAAMAMITAKRIAETRGSDSNISVKLGRRPASQTVGLKEGGMIRGGGDAG